MNRKIKIILSVVIIAILVLVIIFAGKSYNVKKSDKTKILTSFYPIYIMVLNITDGAQGIEVSNMAENYKGCIHDYSLSTADMRKFEDCSIFIQNGKSLEKFTDKISDSYPSVYVISASDALDSNKFIYDSDGELNAHIWMNLNNYITEVSYIKDELIKVNPSNAVIYKKNADKYIEQLSELREKFYHLNFSNQKTVLLNESLSYLLNEVDLKYYLVKSDHENSSISAENMIKTIDYIKENNFSSIIVDKDDNTKTAETIKTETKSKVVVLNSGMTGEVRKDAYLNIMNENYKVLYNLQTAETSK